MEIQVRLKHYGNDIVMIQRKYRWLLIFPSWRDWRPLNNDLVEHDLKLVKACKDIEKLLKEREELRKWFTEQKKRFNGGIQTEPFPLKVQSKDYFFRKYPVLLPVDESWKSTLSPAAYGGKNPGLRGEMGIPDRKESMRSAFIPKDLEQFKSALEFTGEFDHVITLREENKSSNNGRDSPRKKRPGESDAEHKERLRNMDNNR